MHEFVEIHIPIKTPLQWRHDGRDGVSNHQPDDCLLNPLFKRRSKKNIKAPRHWPLWGEITGDRWIPRTKVQWGGKYFHLMTSSCTSHIVLGMNFSLQKHGDWNRIDAFIYHWNYIRICHICITTIYHALNMHRMRWECTNHGKCLLVSNWIINHMNINTEWNSFLVIC